MHKDNTPNFQTKLSKLTHFKDFLNNVDVEKDELEKTKRSFVKNNNGAGTDIGNKTKYKYNKVTRKMDDDSLPEIESDIEALDELGVENGKHKYKIVPESKGIKKFENFGGDGEMDLYLNQAEESDKSEFESPGRTSNYMFFGNLESIERQISEIKGWDQEKISTLLDNGHDWADDHISVAKENISQVYDFLKSELE